MPLEQLIALAILAFVGSFTPGPNNMIATVTGANHGFRAALPHVLGVPFGFASMLIAGAAGIAALLLNYPFIAELIKWAGIVYLLFIAWQLARPNATGKELNRSAIKPLSFWQSAAFQYANPKAWMLAAATTGSFMASNAAIARMAIIAFLGTFFSSCAGASFLLSAGSYGNSSISRPGSRRTTKGALRKLIATTSPHHQPRLPDEIDAILSYHSPARKIEESSKGETAPEGKLYRVKLNKTHQVRDLRKFP